METSEEKKCCGPKKCRCLCHKMDGVGNEFGPDLTKLDAKLTPEDILRDVLEPSFKINEKYQSYRFQMASGQAVTGLVTDENGEFVKVVENPLAKRVLAGDFAPGNRVRVDLDESTGDYTFTRIEAPERVAV